MSHEDIKKQLKLMNKSQLINYMMKLFRYKQPDEIVLNLIQEELEDRLNTKKYAIIVNSHYKFMLN